MARKSVKNSWLKKTLSEKAILAVFISVLIFLFLMAGLSIYFFKRRYSPPSRPKKTTETPQKTGILDKTNVVDVDIRITKNGFSPDTVTIQAAKEYNFRVLKDADASCQSLENKDLGTNVQVIRTGTEIPMIIASRGTYTYQCNGQKAALTVSVK